MTHTPGPWWKSYDLGTYEIRANGGVVVAKDCTKEDADVIASMPDMLAALKLALKQIKETQDALVGQGLQIAGWHLNGDLEPVESFFSDSDCGAVEAIEAAIAKAEGRTA